MIHSNHLVDKPWSLSEREEGGRKKVVPRKTGPHDTCLGAGNVFFQDVSCIQVGGYRGYYGRNTSVIQSVRDTGSGDLFSRLR